MYIVKLLGDGPIRYFQDDGKLFTCVRAEAARYSLADAFREIGWSYGLVGNAITLVLESDDGTDEISVGIASRRNQPKDYIESRRIPEVTT